MTCTSTDLDALIAKAAALDTLTTALTNQWHDGRWSWFNLSPCGGPMRSTRSEAVEDLLAWSQRVVKRQRVKAIRRIALEVISVPV